MPYAVVVHPNSEIHVIESPLTLDLIQSAADIDVVASIPLDHSIEALFDDEGAVNESLPPNVLSTFGVVNLGYDAEDIIGGWLSGSVLFAAKADEDGQRPELTDEQWTVLRTLIGF